MNSRIKIQIGQGLILACVNFSLLVQAKAQTFTNLYSFDGSNGEAYPADGLTLSDNMLYGTTTGNGSDAVAGTIFAVSIDGSVFTNLQSFDGGTNGAYPYSGVILSDDILYGTTELGGDNFGGMIFALDTSDLTFTNLHSFDGGSDGFYPRGRLLLANDTLYGTASGGGSAILYGTIFSFDTASMTFSNLHSFMATSGGLGSGTNCDGANPQAGLILSGNMLYGVAENGGLYGYGTVFAVDTNGLCFTNLYNFTGGGDGGFARAILVSNSNILYGTASAGGTMDDGTVFALNSDGTCFTNLHSFSGSDGAYPDASLILSSNTLYGTTSEGGIMNNGTVFAVDTDGTGFTNLYSFTGGDDGSFPGGGLVLSNATLYGTTVYGGVFGYGTVFSLALASPQLTTSPQLTITLAGTNIIVTWPLNVTGFVLQTATNLDSPVWVALAGQNAVTNSISDQQRFFRLSQSSP